MVCFRSDSWAVILTASKITEAITKKVKFFKFESKKSKLKNYSVDESSDLIEQLAKV